MQKNIFVMEGFWFFIYKIRYQDHQFKTFLITSFLLKQKKIYWDFYHVQQALSYGNRICILIINRIVFLKLTTSKSFVIKTYRSKFNNWKSAGHILRFVSSNWNRKQRPTNNHQYYALPSQPHFLLCFYQKRIFN